MSARRCATTFRAPVSPPGDRMWWAVATTRTFGSGRSSKPPTVSPACNSLIGSSAAHRPHVAGCAFLALGFRREVALSQRRGGSDHRGLRLLDRLVADVDDVA